MAPRQDELLDGVLLRLEARLLGEKKLETARLVVLGPARVHRDVHAVALGDALLRLGGLAGLLVLGPARGLELGQDETALEKDLLDTLGVVDEPRVNGARLRAC